METQDSESIDISSIRKELLRHLLPKSISKSDAKISRHGQLPAVKDAFGQAVSSEPEYREWQNTHALPTNTQRAGQQETQGFSHLASTVPDSQGTQHPLDVSPSLQPLALPQNVAFVNKDILNRMATQNSSHDTQELSPSYYERIINVHKNEAVRELEGREQFQEADDGTTQRTAHTGDPGHVDLGLGDSGDDGDGPQNADAELDSEPIEFSPTQPTQNRLSQFPESQRYKTPATNGKKRDYRGDTAESPALPRNPLARNGVTKTSVYALGLSQAFAATQAGSSPPKTRLTSELTSDRPSPNIEIQAKPATSSLSSPLRPRSGLNSAVHEPQSRYISIKQSQAKRERNAALKQQSSAGIAADEQSDDDFDVEPSLIERTRRQRERQGHIRQQFARFSSVSRPESPAKLNNRPVGTATAEASSPIYNYSRSFGPDFTPEGKIMSPEALVAEESEEEETDREDRARIIVRHSSQQEQLEGDEEDKENFETRPLQVPETVARLNQGLNESIQQHESPLLRLSYNGPVQNHDDSLPRLQQPLMHDFIPRESPVVAVANSQPEQIVSNRVAVATTRLSQCVSSGTQVSSAAVGPAQLAVTPQQKTCEAAQIGSCPIMPGDEGQQVRGQVERSYEETASPPKFLHAKQVSTTNGSVDGTGDEDHHRLLTTPLVQPPSTVPETLSTRNERTASKNSMVAVERATGNGAEQISLSKRSSHYETAQTHLSNETLHSRPLNALFSSPSGTKRKRLGDIAAQPSPKKRRGDSDVEDIMAAMEDSEFFNVVDSAAGGSSRIPPGRNLRRLRSIGKRAISGHGTSDSVGSRLTSSPPTTDAVEELQAVDQSAHEPGSKRQLNSGQRRATVWDVQTSPPRAPAPGRSTRDVTHQPRKAPGRASNAQSSKSVQQKNPKVAAKPQRDQNHELGPDPFVEQAPHTAATDRQSDLSSTEIIAPNRVLACFNGHSQGYFPATCIGSTGSESEGTFRYQIRWDDSSRDDIDENGIRRLDLRFGDQVKVDLQGWRRIPYIIRGFKDLTDKNDGEFTDVRGFKTLLLMPKKRKSLPADVSTELVQEVPMAAIYLDRTMWVQMKDRPFHLEPQPGRTPMILDTPQGMPARSGLATPSERPSTPSTPCSRTRRKSEFPAQLSSTAFPTPGAPTITGIFSGMAFGISYDDDDRRQTLAKAISANGGVLLKEDFYEMFEPQLPATSPHQPIAQTTTLALAARFSDLGFVALVTDRHSRKPKYMQALALGLPCLSGRWIEACIGARAIADWQPYLLSAGESLELEGAVRSRVLPPIDAQTVLLNNLILSRPNLLQEQSVIVVTGKGKAEAKWKPYIFLTRVAGAGRIEKCADLKSAKARLDADPDNDYRWIFVDDKELGRAATMLLPKAKAEGSKEIRVVGKEFLCQSLILGSLWGQA